MKPVVLHVYFQAVFNENKPALSFLFANAENAERVHEQILNAAKEYHDRANDRERIIKFETVNGSSSVDVSQVSAMSMDDPMGKGAEALAVWNECNATIAGHNAALRAVAEEQKTKALGAQ